MCGATTGGLSVLGGLPHCGGVVGRDDLGRTERLLTRLAVELTSRVIPYAASIGTSSCACRRPREFSGRAVSLRDQSLRSIALACRTKISGVVGGWSRYCWTRK